MTRRNATPLAITAELVFKTSGIRLQGVLQELERRGCVFEIAGEAPSDLQLESPVHIELPTVYGARIRGRLSQLVGRRLTVNVGREHEVDRRYFPRVRGGIQAEYRRIPNTANEATCRSWLRGLAVADGEPWFRPTPFMSFSPSGLECEDGLDCEIGDMLLLAMRIPRAIGVVRATARVVRVSGEDITKMMAVEFVDVTPEGFEAMTTYTMDCQIDTLNAR